MTLKEFEEYLKLGIVKRQSINLDRAKALLKESEEKFSFLKLSLSKINAIKVYPNFIIDYSYDILMEIIRAKMFSEGYNSGNSHEAEVSYLKLLGFSDSELRQMDELRYNRNRIKYYGTNFEEEYSNIILNFLESIYPRIKKTLSLNK